MNNLNLRCNVCAMDARRAAQRMVVPFASCATQQTHAYAATLRAGAALGAFRCCKPLVVNDTTARLAPWTAPKAAPAYVQVIHLRALSTLLFFVTLQRQILVAADPALRQRQARADFVPNQHENMQQGKADKEIVASSCGCLTISSSQANSDPVDCVTAARVSPVTAIISNTPYTAR